MAFRTARFRRRLSRGALTAALGLGLAATASAAADAPMPASPEEPSLYICLSNSCSTPAQTANSRSAPAGGSATTIRSPAATPGSAGAAPAWSGPTDNYMYWSGSADDLLKAWSGSDNPLLTRLIEPMVPGTAQFLPSDDGAQVLTYELAAGGTKTITRGGASNPPGYTQVRTMRRAPLAQ